MVSAEIAENLNGTFFLKKVIFGMGEKVVFTNCVFEKLCYSENTIFIVLSANTAVATKNVLKQPERL